MPRRLQLTPKAIGDCRRRTGWSQQQLADLLGIERYNVSQWERRRSEPRGTTRMMLAALMSLGGGPWEAEGEGWELLQAAWRLARVIACSSTVEDVWWQQQFGRVSTLLIDPADPSGVADLSASAAVAYLGDGGKPLRGRQASEVIAVKELGPLCGAALRPGGVLVVVTPGVRTRSIRDALGEHLTLFHTLDGHFAGLEQRTKVLAFSRGKPAPDSLRFAELSELDINDTDDQARALHCLTKSGEVLLVVGSADWLAHRAIKLGRRVVLAGRDPVSLADEQTKLGDMLWELA